MEIQHYVKRSKTIEIDFETNSVSDFQTKLRAIFNSIIDAGNIPASSDLSAFPAEVAGGPTTITGTIKCAFLGGRIQSSPKAKWLLNFGSRKKYIPLAPLSP